MPSIKYVIELSNQEKVRLMEIVKKGNSPARTILRANILLASDKQNDRYMTVSEIANAYRTTPTTVQTVRAFYCKKGLEATITRKKRETPPIPAKVTGEVEAHIIALACGQPPEGYSKWTLRLLANKTVELGYIESISHVTVSTILKQLESEGLIERKSVIIDARLKKVVPTPAAEMINEACSKEITHFFYDLASNLTDNEMSTFVKVLDTMKKNSERIRNDLSRDIF